MTDMKYAEKSEVAAIVDDVVERLIECRHNGTSSFVMLPILYPDGSNVSLKIDPAPGGVMVTDGGCAYREIEAIGAERSFGKTATAIAEQHFVERNRRVIYSECTFDALYRTVCDVAIASWKTVDAIYERISDADEDEVSDQLRLRLASVFGHKSVEQEHKIVGASSNEWDVSAIVHINSHRAVFHAVGDHPNSIYRASTAFRDLSELDRPPTLIAVVKSKIDLGPKLSLLAQAGKVIEAGQPDDVFRSAAA